MAAVDERQQLYLAPNEYVQVLDRNKGLVKVQVGPTKLTPGEQEAFVVLEDSNRTGRDDKTSKRFRSVDLQQAIRAFVLAKQDEYVELTNPTSGTTGPNTHPPLGKDSEPPELQYGKKENIPGPVTFALYPGQEARVISGHRLRSNQYLIIRVYDEVAARENWAKAVMKPAAQLAGSSTGQRQAEGGEAQQTVAQTAVEQITLGQLFVIKGTECSFYIPPTGVEVIGDEGKNYVQEAVTLESLEYAILLDESGEKRYEQGPQVVFPEPTETFVQEGSRRKFRAIELNPISGLYVKVIADYEEDGQQHKVGEELFITGKEQMFYFPRAEHAILKYGDDSQVHYATAIPAGESRYVMDRLSSAIRLVKGPVMALPDPRNEVLVRRILDDKTCELWFPGSQAALDHNRALRSAIVADAKIPDLVSEEDLRRTRHRGSESAERGVSRGEGFAGDLIERSATYTRPRTISLDTKYDGGISLDIYTGYAVLVVSRSGGRRVVVGPNPVTLEYDESLESMDLSKGTPKTRDKTLRTVYLRVLHNRVSDEVMGETSDLCQVRIRLCYRVNFEGETEKWFNVVDYVGFLTDHLRSLLRHAIKQHGIEDFHRNAVQIVRDTVLGPAAEGKPRSGRSFDENGMRIYEVEVLGVTIDDGDIQRQIVTAQHDAVRQMLELARQERELELTKKAEAMKREKAVEQSTTIIAGTDLKLTEQQKSHELTMAELAAKAAADLAQLETDQQAELISAAIGEIIRAVKKADAELLTVIAGEQQALILKKLEAETMAVTERLKAAGADLLQVLNSYADKHLLEQLSADMAPLAILGGGSVVEVLQKLLAGSPLGGVLAGWQTNGGSPATPEVVTAMRD